MWSRVADPVRRVPFAHGIVPSAPAPLSFPGQYSHVSPRALLAASLLHGVLLLLLMLGIDYVTVRTPVQPMTVALEMLPTLTPASAAPPSQAVPAQAPEPTPSPAPLSAEAPSPPEATASVPAPATAAVPQPRDAPSPPPQPVVAAVPPEPAAHPASPPLAATNLESLAKIPPPPPATAASPALAKARAPRSPPSATVPRHESRRARMRPRVVAEPTPGEPTSKPVVVPRKTAGSGTPASSPATAAPIVSQSWEIQLSAWLEAHKRYPELARERHEQGAASLRFTVARDGSVLAVSLVGNSGSALLNAAAIALLHHARVPPFPPAMREPQITVIVAVRYMLER